MGLHWVVHSVGDKWDCIEWCMTRGQVGLYWVVHDEGTSGTILGGA